MFPPSKDRYTVQYVVYSCFCAQVYDYNYVKMCIQNSCYVTFVKL